MTRRRTLLCGLVGSGIAGSRSPAMHETEAAAMGLTLVYRLIDGAVQGFDADSLPALLAWLERFGFDGVNVTHPFKQAVLPYLHSLSDEASALGAVNTVLFRDGRRIGHNTDWSGYAGNFRRGLHDVARRRVAQFGAGGAAAAVGYAMLKLGVRELVLTDVERIRADALAARLSALFPDARVVVAADAAAAIDGADGVVQTTPVGMQDHPGLPFPPELLSPSQWVSEIIYFPRETALLRAARSLGCKTLDGTGMAVLQAADALEHFTGVNPDRDRMLREFDRSAV